MNGWRRYTHTDIHTHIMGYYSAIKKINVICSNMDGPRDYHAKWSKSKEGKHHIISLTCGIWTMMQMNLFMKQIDSQT